MDKEIKSAIDAREKVWCLALLRTLCIDDVDMVLKEFIRLRDEGFTITIGKDNK